MDKYFVINNSDGDTYVEEVSKKELLERINEDYYSPVKFLDKIKDEDTNYWGNGLLIIKGEIVVPKAEKVVEVYKI